MPPKEDDFAVQDHKYETLLVSWDAGVVTVTLNRPEKKNAVNATMWNELAQVIGLVSRTRTDRVLVLRGAGGAFCSGADLSGGSSGLPPLQDMQHIHSVALALHQLSQPALALVDGDAVGAGCNLALGCDMVFATPRSRFAQIFVRRGLSVDFGGSWILPRLIGLHRAKLLCLTGKFLSADEAAAMGLINEVVAEELIDRTVMDLAGQLAAGPPVAQALIKKLLNAGVHSSMADALDAESAAQALNMSIPDSTEAISAFREKRVPDFNRRREAPREESSL